jgi:hypothetical protein
VLTITEWALLGLAGGVLLLALIAFVFFILPRIREKRRVLEAGGEPTSLSAPDRAFNQIQLARSAADHLAQTGVDVRVARSLLDQASSAYDKRRYDTALALVSSAREALLTRRDAPPSTLPAAQSRPPTHFAPETSPSSAGPTIAPRMSPPPGGAGPRDDEEMPQDSGAVRLPKNKAESRFQLTLLDEELAAAPAGAGSSTNEARALSAQGHQAFDRGDYTEALKLGLKGRRRVGARVETLPPPSTGEPDAGGSSTVPDSSTAAHCGTCGQPLGATDRFCRGCGSPRSAARCASCGEALATDDKFCGACGAPIRG